MRRDETRSTATAPGADQFRAAVPGDAPTLAGMVLAGVRHWGHDINFPQAYEALAADGLPTREFVRRHHVEVLADAAGPAGFYSLVDRGDAVVELVHMFVSPDRLRRGIGRRLWLRSVDRADAHGARRLELFADPCAVEFYAAMGARQELGVEVVPGFLLARMSYDLDECVRGAAARPRSPG